MARIGAVMAYVNTLVSVASDSRPVPPVEAFDEWLSARGRRNNAGGRALTGVRLRRIVLARRGASTFAEIGRCLNMTGQRVCKLFNSLPEEFR